MNPYTENISRSKYADIIERNYRLKKNIEFGASFYFVYDVVKESYPYLEKEFYEVTGYPPSLIMRGKIDYITRYIHPDDAQQYHHASLKWRDIIENYSNKDREIEASFDFRLLSSEGRAIRLLHQTLHIEFSHIGKMLFIIGKCSDISHWNKSNDMILSITSSEGIKNFYFPSMPKSNTTIKVFSPQEKKIIRLLAEGNNSKDIAGEMAITFNTANTHRRNMLRKANVRNTSELVSYAHSHHLV